MSKADLHLKLKQLCAIGRFAAQWGYFEAEMNFTISALSHLVSGDQRIPTRFKERANYWRKMARAYFKDAKTLREAETIIDDALDLHKGRSVMIHGRVYGHPNPRSRRLFIDSHRHLKEWRKEFREITADDLIEGALLTEAITNRLIDFNERHMPIVPPTLPRKYS